MNFLIYGGIIIPLEHIQLMELVGSRLGETDNNVKNLSCVDELGDLFLFLDIKNYYNLDLPLIDNIITRIKLNGTLEVLNNSDSNTQLSCKTAINLSSLLNPISNSSKHPSNAD